MGGVKKHPGGVVSLRGSQEREGGNATEKCWPLVAESGVTGK